VYLDGVEKLGSLSEDDKLDDESDEKSIWATKCLFGLLFSMEVDSTTIFPARAFSRLRARFDLTTSAPFFVFEVARVNCDSLGFFLDVPVKYT